MPMVWNDAANAKLLVAIIATAKPKLDLNALAEYMGPECTTRAVANQILKLKTLAKNEDSVKPEDSSTTTTPVKKTPEKRKRATPKNSNKTPKTPTTASKKKKDASAAKVVDSFVCDDDDDDEEESSPLVIVKKSKGELAVDMARIPAFRKHDEDEKDDHEVWV